MSHGEHGSIAPPPPEYRVIQQMVAASTTIDQLRTRLIDGQGVPVNFGFALDRNLRGFDIAWGNRRFLGYVSSMQDMQTQTLLEESGVATFQRVALNEQAEIIVLDVPLSARPLDSMGLKNPRPKTGSVIGAFEMMAEAGKYLADIYKVVNGLPDFLDLQKLVFLNGAKRFIRLVPPFLFSSHVKITDLMRDLETSLNQQQPQLVNLHKEYVEYFEEHFQGRLEESDQDND